MVKNNSTETKNLQYAGLAIRTKAFAYDYLLISGYIIFLAGVTMAITKTARLLGLSLIWPENPILANLIAFATTILPVALYFTLTESSPRQATWGKRKVGIRVVDANGGTLSRKGALVRSLLKLLPWQIAHTCLFQALAVTPMPPWVTSGYVLLYVLVGFYIASALISKKNRTPYDWVSGSYGIVED